MRAGSRKEGCGGALGGRRGGAGGGGGEEGDKGGKERAGLILLSRSLPPGNPPEGIHHAIPINNQFNQLGLVKEEL